MEAAGQNSLLWSFATVLGPIVLIAVIVYALLARRRLSAGEREAQKQGTERMYRKEGE